MIIGRVDGIPELRHTPGGRAVTSFSVGTPRTWTTPEGEQRSETDWFNVVAWGNLAEFCGKHLASHDQVYIEGRLQTRSWEDSEGRRNFRTEVVAHEIIMLSDQSDGS